MKKNIKKGLLKVVGKIVEFESNVAIADWPPICAGLIHQPKRPLKK